MIYGTIAYGKLIVKDNRHTQQEAIRHSFQEAMKALMNR